MRWGPVMERGTVKSYDQSCGMGLISRLANADVKFYAGSILGRDRIDLKQGDPVWFEVDNIKNLHIAINIRKCM